MHLRATILSSMLSLALPLVIPGGCAEHPHADATTKAEPAAIDRDGPELNGVRLNGIAMNGVAMNGVTFNGVSLLGTELGSIGAVVPLGGKLGGISFGELKVHESVIYASLEVDDEMVTFSSDHLVGARLLFDAIITKPTGETTTSQLLAAVVGVEELEGTALAHRMMVYDPSSTSWVDPCPANGGKGLLLLPGAWDLKTGDDLGGDVVTLACRDDVLAKCVEWGYEPWLSEKHAELHQACTRMARADYCGDGTPMTIDGTPIDVYDTLDIQVQETKWPVEAEWGPDGATCIGGEVLRAELLGIDKPDCLGELVMPECGELRGESRLANRYAG